jgi:hypothetical protein
MRGVIKWIRHDGDGYITSEGQTYYFHDLSLVDVLSRGDQVCFEEKKVLDKRLAFNVNLEQGERQ